MSAARRYSPARMDVTHSDRAETHRQVDEDPFRYHRTDWPPAYGAIELDPDSRFSGRI